VLFVPVDACCADWPFTGPECPITVRVSGGFIANNSAIVKVTARAVAGVPGD
jgi:hypothetical protein